MSDHPPAAGGAPGIWASLSFAGYRSLFLSTVVVIFGVMGQAVGRGWLAHELTGSNAGLGGVMLAFGFAMLIATPWGGVAADRFAKRSVLLVSVTVLTLSSAGVGLAAAFDVIEYWMLVVASAFQAAAFAFYLPARIAFIAELVAAEHIPNAVMLSQISQEAARLGAPALAGVLIGVAWFGVAGVFLMAAALGVASLFLVARLPRGLATDRAAADDATPFQEMADAWRYISSRPALALISMTTIAVVVLGFPYLTFLPTIASDRFEVGAAGYGAMSASAGLGAVLAGIMSARSTRPNRPWLMMALGGAVFGVALIGLGLAPTFPLALLALLLVGAGGLIFQTTSQSLLLALSDFEYHGRMQSMVILGFSGFGLAALPLGLAADAITLRLTMVLMGVAVLGAVGLFAGARRRYGIARSPLELA